MNPSGSEDPFEKLLRDAAPPVEDRGFSIRVMNAVDAGRRRARFRLLAIALGGATGLTVAATAGAFGPGIATLSSELQRSFTEVAALAANPAVVVATMAIIAALIYAFRREESDPLSR